MRNLFFKISLSLSLVAVFYALPVNASAVTLSQTGWAVPSDSFYTEDFLPLRILKIDVTSGCTSDLNEIDFDAPDGSNVSMVGSPECHTDPFSSWSQLLPSTTYYAIENDGSCEVWTYPEIKSDPCFIGETTLTTPAYSESSPSVDVTVPSLVSDADSQFTSAMGFGWADVVNFTGDNVKLVVGSGIGLLYFLWPWIIALVMIAVTIGLIWAGFKFFRH